MSQRNISAENVPNITAPPKQEQQAEVIDFTHSLAKRNGLRVPDEISLEGPEYHQWCQNIQAHARIALEKHRMKMEEAGLSPDGPLPEEEWPEDMRPMSSTSVET